MGRNNTEEKKISIKGVDQVRLFGLQDIHLRKLQDRYGIKVFARGNALTLSGNSDRIERAERIIHELIQMVNRDQTVTEKDFEMIFELVEVNDKTNGLAVEDGDSVILYKRDGYIKPKSKGQSDFYQASEKDDIVFVIGPAGTGKTYLAVAIAVAALRDRLVGRIVLTRPAVEAGERLGFLPGDLREKIDPYLRPLYDALHDMIPAEKLKKYLESQVIEIVPLAYMRGRTLNNAFVILDEAQNTSFNQMKMFLTRLGLNSKSIITGDTTQVDLPDSGTSGLIQVESILNEIDGISFVYLSDRDVVRHKLVRDIIKAYDQFENNKKNQH